MKKIMKNKIAQWTIGSVLLIVLALSFASCNAIAGTGLNQSGETVWIRLVPAVAVEGKTTLVLDLSKPIPGLTNETSPQELAALFRFENVEGALGAEKITPLRIKKDSVAVYTLSVDNVPALEQGTILVTINKTGITPSTRTWSLDGEVYDISLSQTDGGGILDDTLYSFPEIVVGRTPPVLEVTVSNLGSKPTAELSVVLSGDDADSFKLSSSTLLPIASGGTVQNAFTVQPNEGLGAGDYRATVTVRDANHPSVSFQLNLTVIPVPQWSHNQDPLDELAEYYVSNNGKGNKDGSDWDNAVNNKKLFDVLDTAAAFAAGGGVVKVYVAGGTYIPWNTKSDEVPTSPAATFTLASNVEVYGGFANGLSGTTTTQMMNERSARFGVDGTGKGYGTLPDDSPYETILSGDLAGDDENIDIISAEDFTVMNDNVYHVLTIPSSTNDAATLDGFTVKGGNAAGEALDAFGGGLYSLVNPQDEFNPSMLTLTRLTIRGNRAVFGGGLANLLFSALRVDNVTIMSNLAIQGGGGIANLLNSGAVTPLFTNVTIAGNRVSDGSLAPREDANGSGGGGIFSFNAGYTLTNVDITGNISNSDGGGVFNFDSSPVCTNVTIAGNKTNNGSGGGMYNGWRSNPQIRNSIVWGNAAANDAQVFNDSARPIWSFSLVEGSGGSGSSWVDYLGADNGNNIDADPRFASPRSADSAPTRAGSYRLQAGSPALNAGSDSYYGEAQSPDLHLITTDRDGKPRFNGTVDMGPWEFQ
jgi:hypothetical protein